MVSQTTINVLGVIGGVVLAICQAPQLIKLWRTKSAGDLSYLYLGLYSVGLLFITVYLYLEKATVGWICELIETACGFLLIIAKYWLDNWGPLSARAQAKQRAEDSAHGNDSAYAGPLHPCGKALAGSGSSGVGSPCNDAKGEQGIHDADSADMAWPAFSRV
ncbi:hypothetical protein ABPG77_004804 [Micractinium sp. CCAP 211/92]